MRALTTSIFMTAALALSAPASAKNSQKFESSLNAPISGAVKVEIIIGDDLNWRANNLPKKLRDRNGVRSFNDGFAGNGFYGERELTRLAARLEKRMEDRLVRQGLEISENAAQTLRITLTDARPNRPTPRQMSKSPGLSFQSFGIGGASFEGELVSSSGESKGTISYAWYDTDIRDAYYTAGTWSDAYRAIDRFAKKTAKSIN